MVIQPNLLALSDSLSLLERLESESVDLVYLDPPSLVSSATNGEEQINDVYFEFIYKVLQQSFRILKNNGSVFLFSNYEFGVDFHLLLRKVFGSSNRKQDFIIPRRVVRSSPVRGMSAYDNMLVYGKQCFNLNTRVKNLDTKDIDRLFPYNGKEGRYRRVSLFSPVFRENLSFTWGEHVPPKGQSWRYSLERLNELEKEGYIEENNGLPTLKQFASVDDFVVDVGAVWDDLAHLYKRDYDSQQPVQLLERILQVSTQPGAIVVDPFCGSGTMPVACLQLARQFIASDLSGEAFRISMERIERENAESATQSFPSFIDDTQLKEYPIIWNKYLTASPTEEDVIIQMIESDEGGTTEFKESLAWNYITNSKLEKNTDLLKAMAAFMNAEGGTVIIGVRNDKSLIDLTLDYKAANSQKKDRDGYSLFINDKVRNKVTPVPVSGYNIRFFTINSCEICIIKVHKMDYPTFVEGVFYVRNDNQSIPLNNEQFYDYLGSRFTK